MSVSARQLRAGVPAGSELCSCPYCGSSVDPSALSFKQAILSARLTSSVRIMVNLLADRPGHWLPTERLIDRLYGEREDGGPATANNTIGAMLCHARHELRRVGLVVETTWGVGIRSSERRIVRLPHDQEREQIAGVEANPSGLTQSTRVQIAT